MSNSEYVTRQMRKHLGKSDFIPTRYPHTYAYDFLRITEPKPDNSRGEQAEFVRLTCQRNGFDTDVVLCQLADAYILMYEAESTLKLRIREMADRIATPDKWGTMVPEDLRIALDLRSDP